MRGRGRIRKKLAAAVPGLLVALVWEVGARAMPNGEFRFASPSSIAAAAAADFRSFGIFLDLGLTAGETASGLLLGCGVGTLVGLLLCLNEDLGRLCQPYIVILGAVPIIAMAPVVIQVFGTGFVAKVALAGFSALLVSISLAYEGALTAQRDWLEFGRALGASRLKVVRKIRFPSAVAFVLAGARLNVGFALIGSFIGEYISSDAGLGRYIQRNGGIYDIPRVFLGVGLLALLGVVLTRGVSFIGRRWIQGGYVNPSGNPA